MFVCADDVYWPVSDPCKHPVHGTRFVTLVLRGRGCGMCMFPPWPFRDPCGHPVHSMCQCVVLCGAVSRVTFHSQFRDPCEHPVHSTCQCVLVCGAVPRVTFHSPFRDPCEHPVHGICQCGGGVVLHCEHFFLKTAPTPHRDSTAAQPYIVIGTPKE